MIVAEQRDGALRKISFELASAARKLADQSGDEVSAILLGSGIEGLAAELGKYGVDKVFVGDNAALEPYITEAHARSSPKLLKKTIRRSCFLARQFRARIFPPAWPLNWPRGLATDCTDVKIDGRQTCWPFARCMPANALAKWSSIPPRQMASLRPNVFRGCGKCQSRRGDQGGCGC